MYTNCTSAMVDGDGRTDLFEVKSGVKQRFNISRFNFFGDRLGNEEDSASGET